MDELKLMNCVIMYTQTSIFGSGLCSFAKNYDKNKKCYAIVTETTQTFQNLIAKSNYCHFSGILIIVIRFKAS